MADELSIDSKALIFATLADVYLSSGMLDEAVSILKDGLARNPNYTLAKIILGRAYYMKGETDEALKLLEAIYPEAKDSENENLFLGHCYKRLADIDKARKHYEAVLRINPDNKDAKKEITTLGVMPAQVPETAVEVKLEPKAESVYEAPSEIEVKSIVDIKGMDQAVPIKEVVLPEGDITAEKETPEPDMGIQEPILKIIIPPPVPETILKGEVEIVLPTKEETGSEVPVSWVETKNEAEAIQKADVPVSGAEAIQKAEIKQEIDVPPGGDEEKTMETLIVESSVTDEVKRRIEALAAANAQDAAIEQGIEPELPVSGAEVKQETDVPVSGAEVKQETDVPVSGAEVKQETDVPVSGAEVKQKTDVPVSGAPTNGIDLAAEIKAEVEKEKPRTKKKVEPKQKDEIPPSGKPEPVLPVSGAEVMQKTDVPVSGAEAKPEEAAPPPIFEEEMKTPVPAGTQTAATGSPFDRLNVPMEKLLSLKTVNAAFISARDGLLIKNYAEKREDVEEISALIASIFNEAMESFKFLNEGPIEKIIIEKSRETICVITAGESLLCVFTQPEAKPGLIFVYARKIIDEIREVLG